MKKNFFKKLSFVLALAMIVSVISPAASAFAAAAPKLNSTKKYLSLGGVSAPSKFDFNVLNSNTKTYKYSYKSSKTAVATVSSGTGVVTAKAVGTTTITCTITTKKTGKTYKKLTATVSVKDGMDSIKLTNVPEKAINVDVANDFGRTFVTESGSTTKTSSITRYAVDSDKAVINETTGVFKATEAGEYNVRVMGFKSTADYKAWLAAGDFNSDAKVVASDSAKVTVAPSIVSVKQTTLNKAEVTFDSDMSKTEVATKGLVYQVINGQQVLTGTEKIKSITLDKTGKVATVEMYANFNQKTEYKFVYGDLNDSFTSATVSLAAIDSIDFTDFTVDPTTGAGYDMYNSIVAKNADGVVIYTGADRDFKNLLKFSYASDGDYTKGFTSNNMAYIYAEGYSVVINAKFETYVYNDTTKKYEPLVKEDAATATGAKANTDVNTSSIQYIVTTASSRPGDTADWTKTSFAMPAGDPAFNIYTRYKKNNDANTYQTDEPFTFKSTDSDKLIAGAHTLVPLKAGVVTVLVYKGDTVVGSFEVTIVSSRAFAGLTQDTTFVKVGNNADASLRETAEVKVYAKDTLNEVLASGVSVTSLAVTNWPSNSTQGAVSVSVATIPTTGDNKGLIKFSATAIADAVPGAYTVKATVSYGGVNKDLYFTVEVNQSNNTDTKKVANYQVVLSKDSTDLKNTADENVVTVDVYGINAAGLRVSKLTQDQFDVTLALAGSEVNTAGVVINNDTVGATTGTSIKVVRNDAGKLKAIATGNYVVTAKLEKDVDTRANGSVVGYAQLAVSDTTSKEANITTTAVSKATYGFVDVAVKAAFEFKLNGSDCEANITGYTVSDGTSKATYITSATAGSQAVVNGSLYVESVEVTVHNTDTSTDTVYTFTVDRTISITN